MNLCRHTGLLLPILLCLKLFIHSSFPSLASGEWLGSSRSWVRAQIPTRAEVGDRVISRREPQPQLPRQAWALLRNLTQRFLLPVLSRKQGQRHSGGPFLSHFCLYRPLRMLLLSETATENPSGSLTSSGFPQTPRWTDAEIFPILKQTVAK